MGDGQRHTLEYGLKTGKYRAGVIILFFTLVYTKTFAIFVVYSDPHFYTG